MSISYYKLFNRNYELKVQQAAHLHLTKTSLL